MSTVFLILMSIQSASMLIDTLVKVSVGGILMPSLRLKIRRLLTTIFQSEHLSMMRAAIRNNIKII
ncbi:MAG: hypothetical protein ACLSBH_08610 [Coprobacillus cateniformis]